MLFSSLSFLLRFKLIVNVVTLSISDFLSQLIEESYILQKKKMGVAGDVSSPGLFGP